MSVEEKQIQVCNPPVRISPHTRIRLPSDQVEYSTESVGDTIEYRFRVFCLEHPELMALPGTSRVVGRFGQPTSTVYLKPVDVALDALRAAGGIITGIVETVGDAAKLSLTLFIKDPDTHQILAEFEAYKPLRTAPPGENPAPHAAPGSGPLQEVDVESAIHSVESPEQLAGVGLALSAEGLPSGMRDTVGKLARPTAILPMGFTMAKIMACAFLQALILPDLLRRIVTAMVMYEDTLREELWFDDFVRLIEHLMGEGGAFHDLRGDDPDDLVDVWTRPNLHAVEERVNALVQIFVETHNLHLTPAKLDALENVA